MWWVTDFALLESIQCTYQPSAQVFFSSTFWRHQFLTSRTELVTSFLTTHTDHALTWHLQLEFQKMHFKDRIDGIFQLCVGKIRLLKKNILFLQQEKESYDLFLFLYTSCVICTASETRRQNSWYIYSCNFCFFQFRAIWRSLKFGMFASSSGKM